MKKILLIFNFSFLIFNSAFSQAGEWVWIKGDSVPNLPGNFGVQGVPSPTNNPPALYEPCEWTDLNGNFWLFGGFGASQFYSDLWKYDPLTNDWTWIKGPGSPNDPGSYGIQGVPSPTNNPPSRCANASWVDSTGNFWLFGGVFTTGTFSDLWRYDILTNEWTWIKGPNTPNQPGVYGVQGVPSPNNIPGARGEIGTAWTDDQGDLWLFGGTPAYDDLWRFHISTTEFTWMKGSQTSNQPGYYGVQGIENTANTPGGRLAYNHWKDENGNLWLFAGYISGTYFNDLWRYNPASGNWAWMKGDTVAGLSFGLYGTKCVFASSNLPGARFENRASWQDFHGNLWTFGGAKSPSISYASNDLWMYSMATGQWVWQSGESFLNPPGSWGTLGVSSSTNSPDGRGGAVGWADGNDHLFLFGGYRASAFYNDLWKYTIDTNCITSSIKENNFTNELLVFPNPANSSLTVLFASSEKQNIELRIYNTLGKQIYFSEVEITTGKFEKEINVEKMTDGIYFLQLKTKEGKNTNRKVIINH